MAISVEEEKEEQKQVHVLLKFYGAFSSAAADEPHTDRPSSSSADPHADKIFNSRTTYHEDKETDAILRKNDELFRITQNLIRKNNLKITECLLPQLINLYGLDNSKSIMPYDCRNDFENFYLFLNNYPECNVNEFMSIIEDALDKMKDITESTNILEDFIELYQEISDYYEIIGSFEPVRLNDLRLINEKKEGIKNFYDLKLEATGFDELETTLNSLIDSFTSGLESSHQSNTMRVKNM